MSKCIGCEVFPKCTAQGYGDVTCRYLRFSYGIDDRTEMSNADRIRAMSDEELTAFLCSKFDCLSCPAMESCVSGQDLFDWLKQPAEEVHNEA